MCQYNNIYTSLHKYLLKKNTNRLQGKKKKRIIAIVAIVPLGTVVTIRALVFRWLRAFTSMAKSIHKTFFLSCDWSQFYILLLYFDL